MRVRLGTITRVGALPVISLLYFRGISGHGQGEFSVSAYTGDLTQGLLEKREKYMGFLRKHFRMVLFLGFAFLRPIPSFGCLSISTPSFSGVTAVGLTLQWNSVCSTAALNYSQLDDDPGFLSPFTQITGGPPSVFGSTAPLIPNTLYFAQVATTSFMAGSVALGSTRTLANLPVALPASVLSSFQLQAQWGTNSNPAATVFETEISSDGFLTLGSSTATTGASFVFGGLPPNTRYDLRVRAMNDDGVRTVFVPLGHCRALR